MQTLEETVEEKQLREPDPVADGRGAPTMDEKLIEDERREEQTNRELDQAKSDINTAIMGSDDPEVQRLQGELLGASAKTVSAVDARQLAERAKEKAGEAITETTAKGVLALSGIGAAMAAMGIVTDGRNYRDSQAFTGELANNLAGPSAPPPPQREQDQGMQRQLKSIA